MRRLFVFAVLCAFLAGFVPRAAVARPAPSLPEALQSVAALIDVQIQTIPDPAVTPADKAALKAWKAAGKAVDQAVAHPSPVRVAGIVADLDKDLLKAFGPTPAVTTMLDELTEGLLGTTAQTLAELRSKVADLPPGRSTDGLLEKLDTADAHLAAAQVAVTRTKARILAVKALRIAATVEKLRKQKVRRLVAVKGLEGIADGARFKVSDITLGKVVKDSINGELRAITIVWDVTTKGVTHHVSFQIDARQLPGDPPEGVPTRVLELRTYALVSDFPAANYERRETGTDDVLILPVSGSITLVSIDTDDPKATIEGFGYASAAGYFSFRGADVSGPGTGPLVTGRFHVPMRPKGLVVAPQ